MPSASARLAAREGEPSEVTPSQTDVSSDEACDLFPPFLQKIHLNFNFRPAPVLLAFTLQRARKMKDPPPRQAVAAAASGQLTGRRDRADSGSCI